MKLSPNAETYDAMQLALTREIVESILSGLKQAGVSDRAMLEEAAGNIAFSVTAIVDGSAVMELNGESLSPVLTFCHPKNEGEIITAGEGGSWMHEYVFGVLSDILDDGGDEG
ncbi:hypothetical protein [Pseudoxanthomonas koreensis]|uniref:hypothetical protein n=1 Tax=Pseudoxanthomonas koreensis TaxID=266061 RepID=UPI0035A658D5